MYAEVMRAKESSSREAFLRYCHFATAPLDSVEFVAMRDKQRTWVGLAYPAGMRGVGMPLFVVRDSDRDGRVFVSSVASAVHDNGGLRGVMFPHALSALELHAMFAYDLEPFYASKHEDFSDYVECLEAAYERAKERAGVKKCRARL